MTLKKTDLAKLAGLRIEGAQKRAGIPSRFGEGSAAAAVSRREQRKLEQARGVIPFAVKIDASLAEQVRERARSRGEAVDDVVAELLRKALAG